MATKTFKLRPKAESDLVDIYQYSLNEWGSARTDSYLKDLSNAFQQLADKYALGTRLQSRAARPSCLQRTFTCGFL